eukprot:m.112431 g.112431  ORF g.112431 m.112431 type:complete len:242 (+) comp12786_c2_seq5:289-1014(+)
MEQCFEGRNVTVLAYGQTGSGKTHTMGMGKSSGMRAGEQSGILPRISQHIFDYIQEQETEAMDQGHAIPEIKLTVSFLELYQEKFYDLIREGEEHVREEAPIVVRDQRRKDGSVFVTVKGLSTLTVKSSQDIMDALHKGTKGRITVKTAMNERSSRSHALHNTDLAPSCCSNSRRTRRRYHNRLKTQHCGFGGVGKVKEVESDGCSCKGRDKHQHGTVCTWKCHICLISHRRTKVSYSIQK